MVKEGTEAGRHMMLIVEIDGEPKYVRSGFVNQLRTLPVRLHAKRK